MGAQDSGGGFAGKRVFPAAGNLRRGSFQSLEFPPPRVLEPGPVNPALRPLVLIVLLAATAAAQTAAPVALHLIGDSTMADKPLVPAHPERGWGQLLPLYFKPTVAIHNHAKNGRSTKSFRDEGLWKPVLESLRPGDYVIIQFGHNDEKYTDPVKFPDPLGQFRTNLVRYATETRAREATPILATPVARRRFDADGKFFTSHGDYPAVVRAVATELNVPLLELTDRTEAALAALGPERSAAWFCQIPPGEFASVAKGLKDDTHLNAYGASRICDLALEELTRAVPALSRELKGGK